MFQRLQNKWKVKGWQVIIILVIFALGGSLTGFAGRKLMNLFDIEMAGLYILIYVLLIAIIWPFAVILVSIPFGQFSFFRRYIRRIGQRLFTSQKN